MQNAAFVIKIVRGAVFCPILIGLAAVCHAWQSPAPASQSPAAAVEMPHTPDALMMLGAKLNGLTGEDIKPWHLKVRYTVTDGKETILEQGTFEELWAGAQKNRTTYTVGTDSQTTYVTDNGVFRTGSLAHPNGLALEVEREFVCPFPAQAYLQHAAFEMHTQTVGATKLDCVQERVSAGIQRFGPAPVIFCFNLDQPILRIDVSAFGARQAIRNQVVLFQGRYVPKQIGITAQDKTTLKAQLENLATIAQVENADFTPPADAKPVPRRIAISSAVAQGILLKSSPPHYPEAAKIAGISGTVVVHTFIGIDGHIHDPEVVSGPPELRQAALDSLKQWEYRPYLLNGEPVEVETQINLVFQLSR